MTLAVTLPSLLLRNAAAMPRRPALRERDRGIWQTLTWSAYAALVRDFALGLAAHGFGRGDHLAVLGDNRPRLYAALLAAQSLGGIGVPLDPDTEPARLATLLREAGVSAAVGEDQEQMETLLALREQLPNLALLVGAARRGLAPSERQLLHDFDAFAAAGAAFAETHPGHVEAEIAKGGANDIALLLVAPRTDRLTGLSHARLLDMAASIAAAEEVRPGDNTLCYLPMATLPDMVYSLALGLTCGFAGNCPEAPHTVPRDLREIGPDILFAPAPVWEALAREIAAHEAGTAGLKRGVFRLFRNLALRAERQARPTLPLRLGRLVGEVVTYGPMRDQLGLSRLRWVHVGEADPNTDIWRLFAAIGVRLRPGVRLDLGALAATLPREASHV